MNFTMGSSSLKVNETDWITSQSLQGLPQVILNLTRNYNPGFPLYTIKALIVQNLLA